MHRNFKRAHLRFRSEPELLIWCALEEGGDEVRRGQISGLQPRSPAWEKTPTPPPSLPPSLAPETPIILLSPLTRYTENRDKACNYCRLQSHYDRSMNSWPLPYCPGKQSHLFDYISLSVNHKRVQTSKKRHAHVIHLADFMGNWPGWFLMATSPSLTMATWILAYSWKSEKSHLNNFPLAPNTMNQSRASSANELRDQFCSQVMDVYIKRLQATLTYF